MAPWIAAFFFEEYHHINFAFTDIPSIECVAAIQELFVYVLENEDSRKRQEEIFFQAVLNRRGRARFLCHSVEAIDWGLLEANYLELASQTG